MRHQTWSLLGVLITLIAVTVFAYDERPDAFDTVAGEKTALVDAPFCVWQDVARTRLDQYVKDVNSKNIPAAEDTPYRSSYEDGDFLPDSSINYRMKIGCVMRDHALGYQVRVPLSLVAKKFEREDFLVYNDVPYLPRPL